jgi:DNA-binding CsgD family transcriptional regulator
MNSASVIEEAGVASLLAARNGAGILFFRSGRIQFINEHARACLRLLQPDAQEKEPRGHFPLVILQLVEEVKDVLKAKVEAKGEQQLESHRLVGDAAHRFLIRALGLPGDSRRNDSVLIILEAIRRNEFLVNGARERFGFTPREQDVISHLVKGWTNKAIAAQLKISVPAVKSHVKQIMKKTNTTTRSGILAELL